MREITMNGMPFKVEGDPEFWNHIDTWEKYSFGIIDRFANENAVMVDVGAYNGVLSIYGSKRFGRVYSLEPDTAAYGHLVKNVKLNDIKNVVFVNSGAGADDGVAELYVKNAGDSVSSLIDRKMEGYETKSVMKIRTIKLSDFLSYIPDVIDLIKMDIEGGEVYVIPEMEKHIREYAPTMYISFHPNWFPEKDKSIEYMANLLDECYDIFDVNLTRVDKEYMIKCLYSNEHNFVFVKK